MSERPADTDGSEASTDTTETTEEPRAGDTTGEQTGDDAATAETGGRPCPRCERPMYHRHCKYVCPEHGVVFDCADTFY